MSDMCTDNTYTSYSSADEYFKSLRLEYQKRPRIWLYVRM